MRIITGKAKGLKLRVPKGLATRPTQDRIKESLFSILNGLIDFGNLTVLDLFAGTGALGLESLSRGATHCTFIDSKTADIIKTNVNNAHLNAESEIVRGDVFKVIRRLSTEGQQFDLIFCDPPYDKGLGQRILNETARLNLLSEGGLLIIEHGFNEILDSSAIELKLIRKAEYGHTTAIEIFLFDQGDKCKDEDT